MQGKHKIYLNYLTKEKKSGALWGVHDIERMASKGTLGKINENSYFFKKKK